MSNVNKSQRGSSISIAASKIADVPDAPTIGAVTDTANGGTVTVAYTAAATGGAVTTFTATSTPGSLTGTGTSPITVTGLTNSTAYTFKVKGTNSTATGPESAASSSVTPTSFLVGAYDSIATATCSGSESSVTFSNIPQGYTHLQIRYMLRTLRTAGYDFQRITFNGDTTSNYSDHLIKGTGTAAASAEANNGGALIHIDYGASDFYTAGIYTVGILDILDYSNTSKYKTTRQLDGFDANGSGYINFTSGNWRSTSAITQIDITKGYTDGFKQYSSFALYGIKGA